MKKQTKEFRRFVDSVGGKVNAADGLDVSLSYVSLLFAGHRMPSANVAQRIHEITNGEISRDVLIWGE